WTPLWIKNPDHSSLHIAGEEQRRHGATPMVAGSLVKMLDRQVRNWW
ncbi:unnamed protein product, partial [Brassica rapa]